MRIQLLHAVGDDPKGAVISVDDRRATVLKRGGYAVDAPAPVSSSKKGKGE